MKTRSQKLVVLGLALSLYAFGARPAAAATDVRDVDQPARKPYLMSTSLTNVPSVPGYGQLFGTVPRGSRFVIEFVSASCSGQGVVPSVLRITSSSTSSAGANTPADHFLAPTIVSDGTEAVFTEMTRIYADSNTPVYLTVFPTSTAMIDCNVTLSGHLVSLR
jgi:hypothetical protein